MKKFDQTNSYKPSDWEKDTAWLVSRLIFLWNTREKDYKTYQANNLGHEKENLYAMKPEIVKQAQKIWR